MMASIANVLKDIYVGDYGLTITITFKDADGNVQDVSGYTTSKLVYAISPDGRKIVTSTASFATDGTDGKITFAFSSGDIDRDGTWEGQAVLTSGTAVVHSKPFEIIVEKRIKG